METRPATSLDERPRILIAQPNRSYLAVLARRMAEAGFRVAAAESVPNAIAELHRAPIDLVLAELDAPRFCGRELVSIIRNDVTFRDVPVLLVTGRSRHGAAIQALRVGADGVVMKPFHFEVLCARIHREIERRRAVEELRQDNRVLDERIIARAIEIGELRERLSAAQADRHRTEVTAAP